MEQLSEMLSGKAGGVLFAFAALFALERLFPAARPLLGRLAEKALARALRLAKNLSFAAINAILSPLIVIPVTAAASDWALDWRPLWLNGAAGLAFDLLLLDLWVYWWHRANHEVPFLWRFHEVHHLDQFLDVTSGVRFHLGEVLMSAVVRAGVIVALAIPLTSVVAFETLLLLATMFHHSNVKLPGRLERALSMLVVTPSIHWVHHHAIRRDTDSNYATILSVWDHLFASRSATIRTPDLRIGVEQESDRPFLSLIARPFRGRN
ncbi:MAG TPA: sterol desaturase family protein [Aestuariivirgaceae bacterium]|jgi:sterol desaturase/sphingolipid hydroxylase (fatty acid hydroxylase superfamily)